MMAADGSTGDISDAKINEGLAVLNTAYNKIGFNFVLQEAPTRTVNDDWYNDKNSVAMKQALRKGGAESLNVFLNLAGEF